MIAARRTCRRAPSALGARFVVLLGLCASHVVSAQPAIDTVRGGQRLTIPYLANDTKPGDLDFTAAECDVSNDAAHMTCRFRQVFVTIAAFDPAACVLTTNGYEQRFEHQSARVWVSTEAPSGTCGVVDTTALEDGGGTRWTMTVAKKATTGAGRAECLAEEGREIYSWRNVRRPLPCKTIQPGAIER